MRNFTIKFNRNYKRKENNKRKATLKGIKSTNFL